MGENESPSDQNKPLEIYYAKVTLRKKDGKKTVRVQIRRFKREYQKKEDFPFPKEIDERDLPPWKPYSGGQIIVYQRKGKYEYLDRNYSRVPMDMAQRLEALVLKVHSKHPLKNSK